MKPRRFAQVRLGVAGLGQGVVALPDELLVRVAGIVRGMIVVVGAFEHLPVLEALLPFGRDIAGAAAAIDVPLADIGRVVAARAESLCEACSVLAQLYVVDEDAVREGVLTGQERGPCR